MSKYAVLTAAVFLAGLTGASSVSAGGYGIYYFDRLSTFAIPCAADIEEVVGVFHCTNASTSRDLGIQDAGCYNASGEQIAGTDALPDTIAPQNTAAVLLSCEDGDVAVYCSVRVSSNRNARCAYTYGGLNARATKY